MLTKTILALSLITGTVTLSNYSQASESQITNINPLQTVSQLPEATDTSKPEYTGIVKQVDDIAQQITVRIATPNIPFYGSGVIIAKDDNTYYIATAGHVLDTNRKYQIVTPDGETYDLDNQTIKESDAYDFAIFSFTSDKDYAVATIGNYSVGANSDQVVFVSGFSKDKTPQRIITGGKAIQKDRASFSVKDAYSLQGNERGLVYTNVFYRGMGGAAILDSEGRLVGINTGSENEIYFDESGNRNDFGLGYSLGVPITDIFPFIERETELKTEWLQTTNNPAAEVSDRDLNSIEAQLLTVRQPDNNAGITAWMNYGNRLWRYGRYSEAVDAFKQVIAIDPDFDRAYYTMGLAHWGQQDYQQAVTAFTKATQIDPDTYYYWRYLGLSYGELNQFDKAISAYERAMALNPEDFVLYVEQGDILRKARRNREAVASYNKALEINPEHPFVYHNRGLVYSDLEQYDNALADLTQAIALNPQFADAYYHRGHVHYKLDNISQTEKDWKQAIVLYEQQKQSERSNNVRELLQSL